MNICLDRFLITAVIFAGLVSGWPAVANSEMADKWRALLAEGSHARSTGDSTKGIESTTQALRLAQDIFGRSDPRTLTTLNLLGELFFARNLYDQAEQSFKEVLLLRREVLGSEHPDTLGSINDMAEVARAKRQYDEAERLYGEAIRLRSAVLGPDYPDTLTSKSGYALLLREVGRYSESEEAYQDILRKRRTMLGDEHPDTLASMNNLAGLLRAQGRYGEAEQLLRPAFEVRRRMAPDHPDTVTAMNNLGSLYFDEGRYDDAEPLLRQVLEDRRRLLGPRHPQTFRSINNLASVYRLQKKYDLAEPMLREALRIRVEVLGRRHPDTSISMNNLALALRDKGDLSKAEALLRETLEIRRDVLGPRHADTLLSVTNLASLLRIRGQFVRAEELLEEALEGISATLGPSHPRTLATRIDRAINFAAQGKVEAAVAELETTEPDLLTWIGAEIYNREEIVARRVLVASQSTYQDVALSLALRPDASPAAKRLAASAVLRFKGLSAEEEAYLARVARSGADPAARAIAAKIAALRSRLARAFFESSDRREVEALQSELRSREFELGRISRKFAEHLQVRDVRLAEVQAHMPTDAALLDIREYRPTDFQTGSYAEPRWAGILLRRTGDPWVVDLSPVTTSRNEVDALLRDPVGPRGRQAAQALHRQLIRPLTASLAGLERLYVAPDGNLYLVPFAALLGPDGKRLAEVMDARLLLSGRDLLRKVAERPATGLIALGGIDYGLSEPLAGAPATGRPKSPPVTGPVAAVRSRSEPMLNATRSEQVRSLTREALGVGFLPLRHSLEEVKRIADLYRAARPAEGVTVWPGPSASEALLKSMERPPRVLHLATHGFYRAPSEPIDRPMLLAGVALAGANRALREADQDGTLYAIEAQDLNLDGTELVVLSACETARGQIDYGEGVSGLVRALRTAGARSILVTLRPVNDQGASRFVTAFYRNWLAQTRSDPSAALRQTQIAQLGGAGAPRPVVPPRAGPGSPDRGTEPLVPSGSSDDPTWVSFILVGE